MPNTMLLSFRDVQDHSLLSVSVTSLAVVVDAYMVESSAYMDTQALFSASGHW